MRINIEIAKVEALADKLGQITAESIGQTALQVVNSVIDDTYRTALPRMISTINLSEPYVRQRMVVVPATNASNPQASIVARGSGADMTILARYGAKQLMGPAKKGGLKRAGVSVEVTRGSTKNIPGGYLMNLSNGNGMGLFTRSPGGKPKHRYGPSVYQLFNTFITYGTDEIEGNLETQLVDAINKQISKALE